MFPLRVENFKENIYELRHYSLVINSYSFAENLIFYNIRKISELPINVIFYKMISK